MSQNSHNSGKICWNVLAESISYETSKRPGALPGHNDIIYCWSINETKAEHFSKVMANVIKDFSETYKAEIIDELNPTKWEYGDFMHSGGSQVCYSDSLIANYLRLNLILLNSNLNKTHMLTYHARYDECSGQVDVLVNNCAVQESIPCHEMQEEEWKRILDINLTSYFRMSKLVLPEMMSNKSGVIINLASIQGLQTLLLFLD